MEAAMKRLLSQAANFSCIWSKRNGCHVGKHIQTAFQTNVCMVRPRSTVAIQYSQNSKAWLYILHRLKPKMIFLGSFSRKLRIFISHYVMRLYKYPISVQTCFIALPLIFCGYQYKNVNFNILKTVLLCARCEAVYPEFMKTESVVPKALMKTQESVKDISLCYSVGESVLLMVRAAGLFCVFLPFLITYPLTYIGPRWFILWMNFLYIAVERSGATFVKLGQWASTRRDLFSKEVCDCFSGLHHRVHPHPWSFTAKALMQAYGKNWQTLLHLVEEQEPIGSGCIAQVYKGYVSTRFVPSAVIKEREKETNKVYFEEGIEINRLIDGKDDDTVSSEGVSNLFVTDEDVIPVAIKVLHPHIRETFQRDLKLMKFAAHFLTTVFPKLHWINLNQCVEEFSVIMDRQLDMRFEYQCLKQFTQDFQSFPSIRVPQPIPRFLRQNILVETFEEGISIGQIIKDSEQPAELKKELATIGMDVLMQMVFVNNFVHGDLHPGNLLVQNIDRFNLQKTAIIQVDALDMMMVNIWPVKENPLKLVLLDCGITVSLGPEDREKFQQVFTAIVKGECEVVADLFLTKSAVNECKDPALFRKDMAEVVSKGRQNLMSMSSIKVADLMNDVFNVLSQHRIQLEANFATIILAIAMLEGLGRSLDPNLNLLEKAKYVLLGSVFE